VIRGQYHYFEHGDKKGGKELGKIREENTYHKRKIFLLAKIFHNKRRGGEKEKQERVHFLNW